MTSRLVQSSSDRGRQITVYANYLSLSSPFPTKQMYQYDVEIKPEIVGRVLERQREIVDRLQNTIAPSVFAQGRAVYDGRSIMISCHELPIGHVSRFNVPMAVRPDPARPNRGVYLVTLTLVKTLDPRCLIEYCNPSASHRVNQPDAVDTINALNLIFRQAPMMRLPHTSKSYYLPHKKRMISDDISLFLGLFQSVRPAINKLYINVNTTAGKFWNPRPVLDVLMGLFNFQDVRRLVNLGPRELREATRYLRGVKVISEHRKDPLPPRPIQSFIREGANQYELDDTGETILNYFSRVYQYNLKFPSVCCVRINEKIVFPLETLQIIPNQFFKHELPARCRDAMLNFTASRPEQRLDAIMNNISELNYPNSDYVRGAGLSVNTNEPRKLTAGVMPSPEILYANGRTARIENGTWNTRDDVFWRGAEVKTWIWVSTVPDSLFSFQKVKQVRDMLSDVMRRRGMKLPRDAAPTFMINAHSLYKELHRLYKEAQERLGGLECLVLITDRSSDLYYTLKHFGDVEVGITTQHLDYRKLVKVNDQICANIAMKKPLAHTDDAQRLNPKLGGINHVPSVKSVAWLRERPTIIFGADTSHPGPGDPEKPTVAALVSSVDETGTKYRATVRIQPSRVEIVQDLREMVVDAVKAFQLYQEHIEKRTVVPQRVLFYRDGVGEGQFQEVCDQEIVAVREAFASMKMPPPTITFVVVGKRHHTRFFPVDQRDADRSGNAPSGLIVDHDIVHPAYVNWFLLSQGGLKGTSRPMHACIMKDENRFPVHTLQHLTFTLTHNFARATRAVSIPTPIYYAHIASGRRQIHFKRPGAGTTATVISGEMSYKDYEDAFHSIHTKMSNKQYFM